MRRTWVDKGRIALGAAVWAAAIVFIAAGANDEGATRAIGRLLDHAANPSPPEYEALFPRDSTVRGGQTVRVETAGEYFSAGRVIDVETTANGLLARVAIFPEYVPLLRADARLESVSSTGDVAWVVSVLLPKAKLEKLKELLGRAWVEEKDRLWHDLEPGLARFAGDVAAALRADLPKLLDSQNDDIRTLSDVVRQRVWNDHLRDAFLAEIWPKAESRAAPIVAKIGDEIVHKAPVFTLSWSYLMQKLPFSDDEAVRRRMRRFIEEEVVPILAAHRDEFKEASMSIVQDALKNEKFVGALEQGLANCVADPRFRAAAKNLLDHWVVSNPRVRELFAGLFARDDVRKPIEALLSDREGDIRAVAHLLLLDDEEYGINPDLARVLRRKILGEGQDWVFLDPGVGNPLAGRRLQGIGGGVK